MTEEKYQNLLERSIRVQEDLNNTSKSLLKTNDTLADNMKKLNDNFVLHQKNDELIQKDIKDIKEELLKWVKRLGIILFVILGGITALRAMGIDITAFIN